MKCPECGGENVHRINKDGYILYGCPDCMFIAPADEFDRGRCCQDKVKERRNG